jgi:hypothetical protein
MRAWHFSENAYPYLPPADTYPSIRVTLPNKVYDPAKGADLYHRYLDEWLIAEDEGVDIMLNEHHQTATCVDPAAPLVLAILAALEEGAAADPRQPDLEPAPAGARRRGDGDDRRNLARAPRSRLRARRALRDPAGQQQPGAHERAPLGGARSHRQGMDDA